MERRLCLILYKNRQGELDVMTMHAKNKWEVVKYCERYYPTYNILAITLFEDEEE